MAADTVLIRCCLCKEHKTASEFYKNRSNKNGLSTMCKPCLREHQRKYKEKPHVRARIEAYLKSEKYKERMRLYRPKGLVNQRRYEKSELGKNTSRRLRQSDSGRTSRREIAARMRRLFPEFHRSHQAVKRAVDKGLMPRASTLKCAKCGNKACDYHHHRGYDKEYRLDVIPLCRQCHNKEAYPNALSDEELLRLYNERKSSNALGQSALTTTSSPHSDGSH